MHVLVSIRRLHGARCDVVQTAQSYQSHVFCSIDLSSMYRSNEPAGRRPADTSITGAVSQADTSDLSVGGGIGIENVSAYLPFGQNPADVSTASGLNTTQITDAGDDPSVSLVNIRCVECRWIYVVHAAVRPICSRAIPCFCECVFWSLKLP